MRGRRADEAGGNGLVPATVVDLDATMRAAKRGDVLRISLAIADGVPVNTRDLRGRTLLEAACRGDHTQLVRFLLYAGATEDPRQRQCAASACSEMVSGLLAPMYEAEELRMAMGVDADPFLAKSRPGVVLRVSGRDTGPETKEAEPLPHGDEAVAELAAVLGLSGTDVHVLRQTLAKEDAGAAARETEIGGEAGGGRKAHEGDEADLETWPLRYARWHLEKAAQHKADRQAEARRSAVMLMSTSATVDLETPREASKEVEKPAPAEAAPDAGSVKRLAAEPRPRRKSHITAAGMFIDNGVAAPRFVPMAAESRPSTSASAGSALALDEADDGSLVRGSRSRSQSRSKKTSLRRNGFYAKTRANIQGLALRQEQIGMAMARPDVPQPWGRWTPTFETFYKWKEACRQAVRDKFGDDAEPLASRSDYDEWCAKYQRKARRTASRAAAGSDSEGDEAKASMPRKPPRTVVDRTNSKKLSSHVRARKHKRSKKLRLRSRQEDRDAKEEARRPPNS